MASEEGRPPTPTGAQPSQDREPGEHTALVSPSEQAIDEAAVVHAAADIPSAQAGQRPGGELQSHDCSVAGGVHAGGVWRGRSGFLVK